jgi:hypothetical protein
MSVVEQFHEEIVELYYDLITPRSAYETTRAFLIFRYGYDTFRDIQSECFKLIGSGRKPCKIDFLK